MLLIAIAAVLTPIAWTLLPLTLVQARRAGAAMGVVTAGTGCFALGLAWIDLAALAEYPAVGGGPWLALVAGTMAASGAWACEKRRDLPDVLRVAALVAFVTAPWSPLTGLAVALGCWTVAPRPRRSFAANDNQSLPRPRASILLTAPVSYPPLRSARPAAFD